MVLFTLQVNSIVIHPNFTATEEEGKVSNDLALIVLEDAVELKENIQSACIHQEKSVEESAVCTFLLSLSFYLLRLLTKSLILCTPFYPAGLQRIRLACYLGQVVGPPFPWSFLACILPLLPRYHQECWLARFLFGSLYS